MAKPSIVKDNEVLRKKIAERIVELNWSQYDVTRDAQARGYEIPTGMLNKYLKHGNHRGALKEEQIVWLATRLGIFIHLQIGKPSIVDSKTEGKKGIVFEVPPYSEKEALRMLKKFFPQTI